MADDGTHLVPVVLAGELDDETRAWLHTQQFPVGAGMNGLAAQLGEPVSTSDYLLEPRIPHEPDDHAVAARLGLRAVAVAPLRAPAGEIMGTLAISYEAPREIDEESIALLQVLADHAAIAVTNGRLDRALRESEERHRFLLAHSPDSIFSIDSDGRIGYLSESTEGMLGWRPDEIVGRPLADIVPPESHPQASALWESLAANPSRQVTVRLNLLRKNGGQIAVESRAVGIVRDGAFAGILGVSREIGRQVRLEGELRESEARYRYLARASPDVVWHVDREGRILFMSDRLEPLTGWRPEEVVGQHWGFLTHPADLPASTAAWDAVQARPGDVQTLRVRMPTKGGGFVPVEIWVTGQVADGAFAGAHGSIRDTRERDRLERELRESEARYRFLLDNSPDVIFSTDADGRFAFLSDSIERITGWPAAELVGQHFSRIIDRDSHEEAGLRWAAARSDPALVQIFRLNLRRRDGGIVPVEVNSLTMTVDGRFAGTHGSARDVSERNRLERDLRQQAAELAASAERAHLARELHDSVTQALFSMTLQTRSAELLLAKDPPAAAEKLVALRDLQRDALAEMRSLIFELRPGGLEQQGLVRALRTHAAAVQGRIGLPITVETELADPDERLPLELEEALYRIAQEAIHNVVRHAGASHVRVSLLRAGDRVHLTVADDGAGFDPSRVPRGHLGLDGMRARAEKVGGRFFVTSRPGHGTMIEVATLSPVAAAGATESAAMADGPGTA
jgi:PAS domain S-box-containing protein